VPEKQQLTRRRFLAREALAAAAVVAAPLVLPSTVQGANERVRVGLIGAGIRGKYLVANMPDSARVVALCDCFLPRIADTLSPRNEFVVPLATFRERDAGRCATYQDYRRLIDEEKLDAIVISAPDHHHVFAAILACQAGRDVYVEKPLSLAIAEGRALVKAAQHFGRIVQVGSQQRTMEINRFACEFVRQGGLGRISRCQLPNYPGPMAYSGLPEEAAPEGLAWDLFCGPTTPHAHNRRLWVKDEFQVEGQLWRGWDVWRDFSGHLMTNWGAHSADMIHMALGMDDTGPIEIWPAQGARTQETRRLPVSMRYANGVELHFTAGGDAWTFFGEKGKMRLARNSFRVDPPDLVHDDPDPSVLRKWQGPGHVARPHLENWLECIKTRRTPNAPAEAGHRTATVCHLANIARELRRRLRWDPHNEAFVGDDEANTLVDRPRRTGFELPRLT
jgi:predicted dehydrogenase